VRDLLNAVVRELASARRLVRAAEQTTGPDRQRTLRGLLESLDVSLVNCGIFAGDAGDVQDDVMRSLRALTLEAQIAGQWNQAVAARRAV